MLYKFLFIVFCLSNLFIAASCKKVQNDSDISGGKFLKKSYSKEELDKLLRNGMTQEEVIKIFGRPVANTGGDDASYLYQINPKDHRIEYGKDYNSGFNVQFSNGKVVFWGVVDASISLDSATPTNGVGVEAPRCPDVDAKPTPEGKPKLDE